MRGKLSVYSLLKLVLMQVAKRPLHYAPKGAKIPEKTEEKQI
jgi:hypothetical protein